LEQAGRSPFCYISIFEFKSTVIELEYHFPFPLTVGNFSSLKISAIFTSVRAAVPPSCLRGRVPTAVRRGAIGATRTIPPPRPKAKNMVYHDYGILRGGVEMLKDQFMTVLEVAQMHGLDRSYIVLLCKRGVFEGAEKVGNLWLIPRPAAENFKTSSISEGMKRAWAARKAKNLLPNYMPPLNELNAAIRKAKKETI
jgi:hypothetical protein